MLPYWSSNSFYGIPATVAIGDTIVAIKRDAKVSLVVSSFRKVGSFDGRGYFAYLLESSDGNVFAGYGEAL